MQSQTFHHLLYFSFHFYLTLSHFVPPLISNTLLNNFKLSYLCEINIKVTSYSSFTFLTIFSSLRISIPFVVSSNISTFLFCSNARANNILFLSPSDTLWPFSSKRKFRDIFFSFRNLSIPVTLITFSNSSFLISLYNLILSNIVPVNIISSCDTKHILSVISLKPNLSIFTLSISIDPLLGFNSLVNNLKIVDLPTPLGPFIKTKSFLFIVKLILSI